MSSSRYGTGLALTKELVEVHNGEIDVVSNEFKGSTFMVSIPYHATTVEKLKNKKLLVVNQKLKLKKEHTILVVENNLESQKYLKLILEKEFNVLLAKSGHDAIEILSKKESDIIISDMVMPVMNGITLCKNIKNDLNFCHIPFILLTSHKDEKYQFEATKAGVDVYITKPFHGDLLKLEVKKIINNHLILKKYFLENVHKNTEENISSHFDIDFVNKLTEFIRKEANNPDLRVGLLANYIGLSKSQLTRKLKAITNRTPGCLILNTRLKIASEMLRNKTVNISEVAYKTGFSDPKYFSIKFKKEFGKLPSQYKKEAHYLKKIQ